MTFDYLKNAWQRMLATAGIEDLHLHDLRHEAISRIAETGKFSLVDLQSISGHLDVRMLLRYSHLCSKKLANRLDEALAEDEVRETHRGRIRLGKAANLSMREVLDISLEEAAVATPPAMSLGRVPPPVRSEEHTSELQSLLRLS